MSHSIFSFGKRVLGQVSGELLEMDGRPGNRYFILFHLDHPVPLTFRALVEPGNDDDAAHEARSAFGAIGNIQICSQLFHYDNLLVVICFSSLFNTLLRQSEQLKKFCFAPVGENKRSVNS